MRKSSKKIIRNRWFYSIELVIDLIIVAFSYYFGFRLQRPDLFITVIPVNVAFTIIYVSFISLIFFLALKINRCGERSYSTTILYIVLAIPVIALSSVFIDYIFKGVGIWRRTMFYSLCFQLPVFIIVKFVISKAHKYIIKLKPCVVVGKTNEESKQFALKIIEDDNNIYEIRCITNQDSKYLYDCIKEIMQVFICPNCSKDIKTEIIEFCVINNIDCAIAPNINDIIINSGKFYNTNDVLFLNMDIKLDIESRIVKRILDIVVSFFLLIVLFPLNIIISLMIKLHDGGKIFCSQVRATRDNKEFKIYKFRTMIEDAENKTGVVLASKDDDRITKLGRFLRKGRLDEIPQLLNVFIGDMTLVGPRPERPELIQKTIKDIPEFRYRTLVKAGLTGLAQTMGRYDTTFYDKLLFDLYYVNNHSILFDLKILFYTLHVLTKPSVTSGISYENKYAIKLLNEKGYTIEYKNDYIEIKDNT